MKDVLPINGPFEEPQPNARVLGGAALYMLKLATEQGTLKAKQADLFKTKANEIREYGLQLSAQFFGARLIIDSFPNSFLRDFDSTIEAATNPLLKFAYFSFYQTYRTELEEKLDLFWSELQAFKPKPLRKRGGQRGHMKYAKVDMEIHIQTMKSATEDGWKMKLSFYRRKVIRTFLAEGKLHKLGGEDTNNSISAHAKRLAMNWPDFELVRKGLQD